MNVNFELKTVVCAGLTVTTTVAILAFFLTCWDGVGGGRHATRTFPLQRNAPLGSPTTSLPAYVPANDLPPSRQQV